MLHVSSRYFAILILVGAIAAVTGCTSPGRSNGGSSVQAGKTDAARVESRLETTGSYLVDGRYLIIPVSPRDKALKSSYAGSYVDGFSWYGLSYSKIYGAYQFVNLVVVDLEKREPFHVFDHPVVLGEWQCSLTRAGGGAIGEENQIRSGSREGYVLRFAGRLLLPARVDDADGDGRITSRDPSRLYLYDLASRSMRPITPPGHELANLHIEGDRLTVVLEKPGEPATTAAVFCYDMKTGEGTLAAEGIVGSP